MFTYFLKKRNTLLGPPSAAKVKTLKLPRSSTVDSRGCLNPQELGLFGNGGQERRKGVIKGQSREIRGE